MVILLIYILQNIIVLLHFILIKPRQSYPVNRSEVNRLQAESIHYLWNATQLCPSSDKTWKVFFLCEQGKSNSCWIAPWKSESKCTGLTRAACVKALIMSIYFPISDSHTVQSHSKSWGIMSAKMHTTIYIMCIHIMRAADSAPYTPEKKWTLRYMNWIKAVAIRKHHNFHITPCFFVFCMYFSTFYGYRNEKHSKAFPLLYATSS